MTALHSKALNSKIEVKRILGKIKGSMPGATIVFFGGIHGNETSGVFALKEALENINTKTAKGTLYAISGNLNALEKHQRYIEEDLNRLWTKQQIETIKNKTSLNADETELLDLLEVLTSILKNNQPPFYFIDLHTTSSKSLPFITINDALINRKFAKQFPVPIVLGIEEYLNGPLLSYINELGYVSLGFESGQHDAMSAIANHIAFVNLALVFSGFLKKEDIFGFSGFYKQLQTESRYIFDVFEIIYLYKVQQHDTFKMLSGFDSFEKITKGTKLAVNNKKEIISRYNGSIFMPLYQKKGSEGFFIIRPIKPFFLKLSAILRRGKVDNWLVLLPGISWFNKKEGALDVDLKIAKFFVKSFFHLLGYRNRHLTRTHLKLNNRERVAKTKIYRKEPWY